MTGPADEQDERLRALLQEAVADVDPPPALPEIRARIAEDGHRQGHRPGWAVITLAAAMVTVVVIGGVAWLNRDHGSAPIAGTGRSVSVAAYYLGTTANGPRLFREDRHLEDVVVSDVQAAVETTLAAPLDPDYRSGFPDGTTATVHSRGNEFVVDLSGADLQAAPAGGANAARMAIQAMVWTVQQAAQRPVSVIFRVDGQPARTLLGVDGSGRFHEADADSTLSPVSVDVAEGAHVPSGTTVYGQAAAYEGNVVWQLRQGDTVVRQGHTTAGQCCTLSPYAFVVKAPPGHYTLLVHDTSGSGREGVGVTTDTKDIVVVR